MFANPVSLARPRRWLIDGVVVGTFVLLAAGVVVLVRDMTAPSHITSQVSTDPSNLPYYAARSLLRMFVALGLSLAFTFVIGTWAARSRRAEKVLIPAIDILQSVPVLGYHAVLHGAVPRLHARELTLEADDLLPLVDAAVMLRLVRLIDGTVVLTRQGVNWTRGGIQPSKAIFACPATENAPLVNTILRALENSRTKSLNRDFFLALLQRGFPQEEAQRQLDIAIDRGRYGELFEYDADSGDLHLA